MTEQLPWDRWTPEEDPDPDKPELPYQPPAPAASPPPAPAPTQPPLPPTSLYDAETALSDALDDLWPMLKEQAIGYAKDSWQEIRKGQTVDVLHPTITAEDKAGKQLVIADAKSRSWRTLIQGLIFDVFAAIVAAVALLSGADPMVRETWIAFGVLLLKSVVSAIISYFMRLRVTPTIKLKTESEMAVMPIPRPIMEENQP